MTQLMTPQFGADILSDVDRAHPDEIARLAYYRVVARRLRDGKETRIRLRG